MITHGGHERARRPEPEPYDPPKVRQGKCKMCGEPKPIREDMNICEECFNYNEDL